MPAEFPAAMLKLRVPSLPVMMAPTLVLPALLSRVEWEASVKVNSSLASVTSVLGLHLAVSGKGWLSFTLTLMGYCVKFHVGAHLARPQPGSVTLKESPTQCPWTLAGGYQKASLWVA